MGIFSRGKKEKEKDEAFQRDAALTEVGRREEQVTFDADLQARMYTLIDPDFHKTILEDEDYKSLYPAYSFLNRTSRIERHDRNLLLLDYEYMSLIMVLNSNEDEYETKGWQKSIAYDIFARYMVNDPLGGWKGHLLTEQVRVLRTQLEKVKKKGAIL